MGSEQAGADDSELLKNKIGALLTTGAPGDAEDSSGRPCGYFGATLRKSPGDAVENSRKFGVPSAAFLFNFFTQTMRFERDATETHAVENSRNDAEICATGLRAFQGRMNRKSRGLTELQMTPAVRGILLLQDPCQSFSICVHSREQLLSFLPLVVVPELPKTFID